MADAHTLFERGRAAWLREDLDEAEEALTEAAGLLEGRPLPLLVSVLDHRAAVRRQAGRVGDALVDLDEAVVLAKRVAPSMREDILGRRALLHTGAGDAEAALADLDAAIGGCEARGQYRLADEYRLHRASVSLDQGDRDAAVTALRQAEAGFVRRHEVGQALSCLQQRGEIQAAAGDMTGLRAEAAAAVRQIDASLHRHLSAHARHVEALILMWAGDVDGARATSDEAVADAQRRSMPTGEARSLRATIALLTGEPPTALEHLDAALAEGVTPGAAGYRSKPVLLSLRALAHARCGDGSAAAVDAAAALAGLRDVHESEVAWVLATAAEAHLVRRAPQPARTLAERAAALGGDDRRDQSVVQVLQARAWLGDIDGIDADIDATTAAVAVVDDGTLTADLLRARALVHAHRGDRLRAEAALDKAALRRPDRDRCGHREDEVVRAWVAATFDERPA